jgi:hypothetical protein
MWLDLHQGLRSPARSQTNRGRPARRLGHPVRRTLRAVITIIITAIATDMQTTMSMRRPARPIRSPLSLHVGFG